MNLTSYFHEKKNGVFFLAALLLFVIILLLPTPGPVDTGEKTISLTTQGKAALAVLAMAVILWITEAIPFPVTACFILLISSR